MALKRQCCFVVLIGLLFITTARADQQERLTITTYYPSPTGVYQTLRLAPTDQPTVTSNDKGKMYYNESNDDIRYYNGTEWKKLGGGWWDVDAAGENITNINTGNVLVGTSANVGIGTTSPATKLHVSGVLNNPSSQQEVVRIEGSGEPSLVIKSASDTPTFNPQIQGRRSRGTIAGPDENHWGDTLLDIRGYGYSGGAYGCSGEINIKGDDPGGVPGQFPGRIEFQTRSTTGAFPVVRMMIISNGNVGIGSYPMVGKLYVNGNIVSTDNIVVTGDIDMYVSGGTHLADSGCVAGGTASTNKGIIQYDDASSRFRGCTPSGWQYLDNNP